MKPPVEEVPNWLSPDEQLRWHLSQAEQHCSRALDLIYGKTLFGVVPRKFWWRRRLLNAQYHLITLIVKEASK